MNSRAASPAWGTRRRLCATPSPSPLCLRWSSLPGRSAVLGITGRSDYLAAWILFVVGVHFVPLGRLFRIRGLQVVGALAAISAAAACVAGMTGGPAPSAVAGLGGGTPMALFAASLMMRQASRASI